MMMMMMDVSLSDFKLIKLYSMKMSSSGPFC
jgi:hypothetical protein